MVLRRYDLQQLQISHHSSSVQEMQSGKAPFTTPDCGLLKEVHTDVSVSLRIKFTCILGNKVCHEQPPSET